jgi:hypothetical protein
VTSQLFLLIVVLIYCQYALTHINLPFWRVFLAPAATEIRERGETVDSMARQMNTLSFMLVAIMTVVYQGGMAVYYVRRRRAVVQAIATEHV